MSDLQTRAAATAKRLIEKHGRDVTLVKLNRTPDDSARPWRGDPTPRDSGSVDSELIVKAVFVKPASLAHMGIVVERDMQHDKTNEFMMIAADSVTSGDLRTFDEVVKGTARYRLDSMQLLEPGMSDILYLMRIVR